MKNQTFSFKRHLYAYFKKKAIFFSDFVSYLSYCNCKKYNIFDFLNNEKIKKMKKIILKCLIAIFGISLFQSCIKLPDISPNGENNISVHIINEDWGYRFDPNNPNEVLLDNVYVDLNNDDSDEIIIESISYYGPASIETTSGVLSELNNHYDVKKMSLGDLSGGTISGSKWVKKSSIAGGEYYIAVRVKLGVNNSIHYGWVKIQSIDGLEVGIANEAGKPIRMGEK